MLLPIVKQYVRSLRIFGELGRNDWSEKSPKYVSRPSSAAKISRKRGPQRNADQNG
jgi:hypothetical protein